MNGTWAAALAYVARGRSDERASVRWLAYWLLLVTLPLETVLVVATAFTIPPYIYLLPVLLGLTLWSASLRDATPSKPVAIAIAVWVTVNVLSLIVWVVDRPPRPHILALYGSLRAGPFRGVFQLAIAVAFLLALPLTAMLAKGRERYAVAIFVGVAAVIALYGVYQSYAEFWRLPLQTLSNDPLTASRGNSAVLGINRARSTFGEPASFGDYVLGPLALATSLAIWGRGRARAVATVASVLLWAGMVLTVSVTTWFAAVIAAIVLVPAIVHSRAWRPALSAVGLAAVIAFVVIWPFVASTPSPASATATTTESAPTTTASTLAPTTTASAPTTTTSTPPPTTAAAPTTTAPPPTTAAAPTTTAPPPTTAAGSTTTATPPTTAAVPTTTAPATTSAPPPASTTPSPPGTPRSSVLGTVWHRITDVFTLGQFTDRYRFFKYEARLGVHHPLLGVGLGGVDLYISKHFNTGSLSTAYGVWIAAFAETGFLGLAALVAIFVVFGIEVVRAARRAKGSPWYPVLVGSYAGILAELAGYVTYGERISAYVWALMGIGLVALRALRSSEPAAP